MKKCHHTAFKKACCESQCPKWVRIQGQHPQTGAPVDEYRCADEWQPILLVDIARQLHTLGAAVESQRNVIDAGLKNALRLEIAKTNRLVGGN